KPKTMTLGNKEFIRRFSQHILPHRFVRIRHYGILSSSWKRGRLRSLQDSLHVRPAEAKPGMTLFRKCPRCKVGKLMTIEVFGKRDPPQVDFPVARTVNAIHPKPPFETQKSRPDKSGRLFKM